MNYLNSILPPEDVDDIIDTFEEEVLLALDDNNVQKIWDYLQKQNIDFVEDIVIQYADLFVLPFEEFVERFERLKDKYFANFVMYLAFHMDILEEMCEN